MNFICHFKRISFYTALVMSILFSCEKEKEYPAFGSMTVESISNSAFLASIEVLSTGEYGIVDHGFYYLISTNDPGTSYIGGYKKSLGRTIESDTISTILLPELGSQYYYENYKFYARAYITDSRGTMYSEYGSAPLVKLNVAGISPAAASAGDTITISGLNFNTDPVQNAVTFNNMPGTIVSAGSNSIRVIVPTGIQYEYYWSPYINVKIKSGTQTVELNSAFRLNPTPVGFSPLTGSWDEMITINGSGLFNCDVYLNSQQVPVSENSPNTIRFYIPADLLNKKFKIFLKHSGVLYEVPGGYFTMEEMNLSTSGTEYYPGQSIVINGTGFNPYSQNNKLMLGEHEINCTYAYSNLTFEIPAQIPGGTYPVKVSNSVDTITLSGTISIIRPVISEVSEYSGYPGTDITISGTNLVRDGFSPSINLGPYSFSPRQQGSSMLLFDVPAIPAGEYTLYAWYGVFGIEAPEKFTVIEPIISSIVPSEGSAGTSVVINGHGFAQSYNNSVYFGNINTPIMSLTDTQINVLVPDSLSPGIWMVQVYMNGQRLSSTVNFTVN